MKAVLKAADMDTAELAAVSGDGFRMDGDDLDPDLLESVNVTGVLTPLLVYRDKDAVILLHGRRRLRAAARLGIRTLPVLFISGPEDLPEVMEAVYLEHRAVRDLNLVEKAGFLNMILRLMPGADPMRWLRLLRLPPVQSTAGLLESIRRLPQQWQQYIVDRNVPLKRVKNLLVTKVPIELLPLLESGCGLNRLERIISLISEISARESVPEAELLAEALPPEDADGKTADPETLLAVLERRRYPVLSAARSRVEGILKDLGKPPFLDLTVDPGLEREGFLLRAQISGREDLARLNTWLNARSAALDRLLERDSDHEKI